MTEYMDIRPEHLIDPSFGREFDPYPASRSRNPSFPNSPVPLGPPTPRIPPAASGSHSVPDVHRLEQDGSGSSGPSSGHQGHTSARSAFGRNIASPTPLPLTLPGPSRFRELDQPEQTHWQEPTHVLYPHSGLSSPLNGRVDTRVSRVSTFAPRHASTPAPRPAQQDYRDNSIHYGAVGSDSFGRSDTHGAGDEYAEYGYEQDDEDANEQFSVLESMMVPPQDPSGEVVAADIPEVLQPAPVRTKGRAKRFVGGFMASIKQVPRMMTGNFSHDPPAAPTNPATLAAQASRPQLPPVAQQPPLSQQLPFAQQSRTPPRTLQQPAYQQQTDPARPAQQSLTPPRTLQQLVYQQQTEAERDRHPDEAEHDALMQMESELPRPHSIPAYAREDSTQSSTGPITPDQTTDAPQIELPNPHDPPPFGINHDPDDPVSVDLQQAVDYSAMEPDYFPETTVSEQINRVGKFFSDLTHLPWIGSHVAAQYDPTESRRARYDKKKPGQSWYSKPNPQKLDLLATASPRPRRAPAPQTQPATRPGPSNSRPNPGRTAPAATRSRDAATAIRPTETPGSITSRGGGEPLSPGASSHGHGRHSYSSYNYYYPQQPMYVVPAASFAPQNARPGESPAMHPSNPPLVYVLPAPPSSRPRDPGVADSPATHLASPAGSDVQLQQPVQVLVPMWAQPAQVMMPASPRRRDTEQQTPVAFPMPMMPVQQSPGGLRPVQPLTPRRSPRGSTQPQPSQSRPQSEPAQSNPKSQTPSRRAQAPLSPSPSPQSGKSRSPP